LRIQGNGTIKLVLDNYAAECNANNYSVYSNSGENNAFLPVEKIYYNDMTTSSNEFKDSNADKLLKAWMDGGSVTYHGYDGSGSTVQKTVNLTANLDKSKLTTTKWCFNKSYDNVRYLNNNFEDVSKENATHYEYSFGLNLENAPSLKCDFVGLDNSKSSIHESYIGLLTADEAVYAGNVLNSNINSNYLNLDNVYSYQVQYINDSDYWLMTPVMHNTLLDVRILYRMGNKIIGNYMNENYHQNNYLRPAIVLRSDVKLSSGNGTQSNPYILAN